jgi:peptidoglycan/xylan/chitin deacetylase (PgdA/CDA1 family)
MKPICKHALKTLLTLSLVTGGLSLAVCAFSWNGFTLAEWWRESHSGIVLWQANTREKVVALTFDDGPDPRYTPRVLAILQKYGVKATFFEEARRVQAHPEIARAVLARGHSLGNHTCTHPYLNRKSPREVAAEMGGCERCFETLLHRKSHLFRPPRGQWNPTIYREAKREDDRIILWTVAVEHREVKTPRAMADRALSLLRPGGILLMHDGAGVDRESTVRALPLILEGLRRRGYRCVTVPDLLHIRGDEPAHPQPQSKEALCLSSQQSSAHASHVGR